jgi:hypothetical protein
VRSLSVAIAFLIACAQTGAPGPGVDTDRAMTFVARIAKPRPVDHTQETVAAIESELRAIGVTYEEQTPGVVELPGIEVLGTLVRERHAIAVMDPNVVVRFGEGKALLVMAHYDSVDGSPGACDNAAAVAILVELARVFHDEPPAQPVILAFTAGEEVGLAGAEALADRVDVDFAISLDLVGGDGPLVLNGASTLIGNAELAWLRDAADRAGVELTAPLPHRVISRWWPQAERSDHGPFTLRGVRAVHFYNRGNDGEWIDTAYHSAHDLPSRVHPEAVAAVGRLVRALAMSPVPAHDGDGVWLAGIIVPRWLLVVLELLLAGATLVVFRQRQPRADGAGLMLGAASYALAIIITIACTQLLQPYAGAWLFAPLPWLFAAAMICVGSFGLIMRIVGRIRRIHGAHRYRAFAALLCLVTGLVVLAIGAPELAWIWLIAGAAIATLPAPLALMFSLLPALLVLQPLQLREASWNGFLPAALPIAGVVSLFLVPPVATGAWWLRSRRTHIGPLGSLVLTVGWGLLLIGGLVVAVTQNPPCSAAEFGQFLLACDRV